MLAQQAVARFAHAHAQDGARDLGAGRARSSSAYDWPGNVRELQNALERAVALTRFDEITVDDLPEKIRDYHELARAGRRQRAIPSELPTLDEVERRYILRVLEAVHGNKTLASRILGLDRKTLYRKLERYGSAD